MMCKAYKTVANAIARRKDTSVEEQILGIASKFRDTADEKGLIRVQLASGAAALQTATDMLQQDCKKYAKWAKGLDDLAFMEDFLEMAAEKEREARKVQRCVDFCESLVEDLKSLAE